MASVQDAFTIDISQLHTDAVRVLRQYGVVVLSNAVDRDVCAEHARQLVLQALSMSDPSVSVRRPDSWVKEKIPPAVRPGLMQGRIGATKAAWDIRTMPIWHTVFEAVYSGLRDKLVSDFTTSIDGINILPPRRETNFDPEAPDWAHIDTTTRRDDDDPSDPELAYTCVQGQLVLNDSTAGFRCSPGSHRLYREIMDIEGVVGNDDAARAGGWCRLSPRNYPEAKRIIEAAGGAFQIPVVAPQGSIILWLSSTLHSAKAQDAHNKHTPTEGPIPNWRVVSYVCYRPKDEVTSLQLALRRDALRTGRCTNHAGNKVFPRYPPTQRDTIYTDTVRRFVDAAEDERFRPAIISPAMRALLYRRGDPTPWSVEKELENIEAFPLRLAGSAAFRRGSRK